MRNRCEVIIKYHVILWWYQSSFGIEYQRHVSWMRRRSTKIYSQSCSRIPFGYSFRICLETTVEHIARTAKCMKIPQSEILCCNTRNLMSGFVPSRLTSSWFRRFCAALSANGHNIIEIYSGQWFWAWTSKFREVKVSCLIIFSAMPFRWCAPTPQRVIHCVLALQSSVKERSAKWPLSAW